MEVIVDGEKNFKLKGDTQNMVEVVGAIIAFLQDKNRAMMSIEVDGKSVSPADLHAVLDNVDMNSVEVLKVQSEDLAILVDQTLSELEEHLPALPAACHSLAAVFHGEHPEEGFDPLTQLITIWGEVKQRQIQVANSLQIDIGDIALNDSTLEQRHTALNEFLEECAGALQKGDCVLLGDLLEYELAPRAEQELQIAGLLKERAAAHFA